MASVGGTLQAHIARALEGMLENAFNAVYELNLVKRVLDELYTPQDWTTQKDAENKAVVRSLRGPQ
jgi:hypothetical protein